MLVIDLRKLIFLTNWGLLKNNLTVFNLSWKNQQNEFRLDKEFQLKCIPTLIQWKKVFKLDLVFFI